MAHGGLTSWWKSDASKLSLRQGMDGSAREPALVQDTEYMIEKPCNLAPYLEPFGAYLLMVGMWQSTQVIYNLVKNPI